MIVAVDGPAGVGKSSVCGQVAKDLGWFYLNSGVFYRATAYLVQSEGLELSTLPPSSIKASLTALWDSFKFRVSPQGFSSTKPEVSWALFSEQIAKKASEIAAFGFIREFVNRKIQECLAAEGDFIVEGRDAATKIVPHAELKVFLDASLEARASRREAELAAKNLQSNHSRLLEEIKLRDQQDKTRKIDPLVTTPESVVIDTTFLEFEQVVGVIKDLIVAASE